MILEPAFSAVVPLPAVWIDPLAWSRDGSWWPAELRVKKIRQGWSQQFVRSDYHRKWQAVVSGPNAAKSTKHFLETSGGDCFPVVGIELGDVIEVGKIHRSHKANFTGWRSYYVVVDRTETRLVLAFSTAWTKAAALRIGNLRKTLGAQREATLASRAAIFEDLTRERSSAEIVDDDAIAEAFL